ncbi:MAG: immunity 8 family protein [Candidatus Kapaibacterium sp.]
MKAILQNIYSTDIDVPLADYQPVDPDNFGFLVRLIIGEEKLGGEESFDVMICTPQWLISNHSKSDIIIGRHHLIVFEYNYERIHSKLKSLIEEIELKTWDEIGLGVGRIGKWEFEDYSE